MPSKPKLGQHFLHDVEAIEHIAASIGDMSGRTVIEIGPGQGAITAALVARAAHVVAIEYDHDLALQMRIAHPPEQLTVVEQDVLQFDFVAAQAEFSPGQRLLVVGNLPYYITSQILLRLAASHAALDRAVLMVQREVADRCTAQPGSRDYGLLSVTVQMFGPAQSIFTLPPGAFTPPPEVYSTVFRWRFASRFAELGVDEQSFQHLVRQAFAQKRKTLANNLRAAGFQPDAVDAALSQAHIEPQARAESLPVDSFAALWHGLNGEQRTVSSEQ